MYGRAVFCGVILGAALRATWFATPEAPVRSAAVGVARPRVEGRRPQSLGAQPAAVPLLGDATAPPPGDATTPPLGDATAPKSAYHSLGKLRSLPQLDIAQPGAAATVAQTRSYKREIIIFESDASMAGWAFYWVGQMRRKGYEHWIILADQEASCTSINSQWQPMVEKHHEQPLSCAWSSYPRTHPGWAQWAPRKGEDNMHNVYILWSTRWWVALQLSRQDVNVLSLDVDAVLLTDIYELLRSPPLSDQDVIITRNTDSSQSLNCGFVYFNRDGSPAGAPAELADCASPQPARGAPSVPAAEWVCELMWERTRLFLEVDVRALTKKPAREVLWEQDAWNDLAKSLELRRRVFPWAVGYGKKSDIWPKLGYERRVIDGMKHREKWVSWLEQAAPGLPPWPAPQERNAKAFFDEDVRRPLLWLPLCAPPNVSSRASAAVPPRTTDGLPLGLVSRLPARSGRLMIAPTWLASLGVDPEVDWAGATPPPFSYLHLTNMWHCFPHMCWSKAGRLFWLRAHGFWDRRLDETGLTPRGVPYDGDTRVLALPDTAFAHMEGLTPPPNSDAATRGLAFRRVHSLIHNLVLVAALLGRRPVIPQVPCAFVRAVQPKSGNPAARSRFGVSHPSVVVTGSAEGSDEQCHVTAGTWRPGAPDQCYHSWAMAQFDFRRFLGSAPLAGASNVSVAVPQPSVWRRGGGDSASHLATIRKLCELGERRHRRGSPVMVLDGLLPVADALLDVPFADDEFVTERERRESEKARWPSLLQKAELKELAAVCPGAQKLISMRKTCVGYFMAE